MLICLRLAAVEGVSGASRRRRSARPTATYDEAAQGNWCASVSPHCSTCSAASQVAAVQHVQSRTVAHYEPPKLDASAFDEN